jgi:Cd2+/Zn2+-exporting ATPase
MSKRHAPAGKEPREEGRCLARSVAATFDAEPALEAVTIDRETQTLSVATMGQTDVPRITGRLTESYEHACIAEGEHECSLLAGTGDCSTCETPLPPALRGRMSIKHSGSQTTIARVTCPTAPSFWRWRSIPLPRFVQRDVELVEAEEHLGEWKWQLLCAMLCAGFGITAYVADGRLPRPSAVGYLFYGLAYLAGSWFAAEELWERLRKQGGVDIHFLMLAVALGAAAVNEWKEGVVLLFLFSFAGALEHFAMERTQREIRSLFRDAPKVATVIDERGEQKEVKVEKIRVGMRLLVKPGSQFPVDAEIVKGTTAADESNLTGEAAPVEKAVADTVLAGTLNLWGVVELTALRPAAESSLQKIIRLIREAQHQKAPAQRFTDKFSAIYTYVVLALSFAMFFVWWLGFKLPPFMPPDPEHPGQAAFYRTMTLLVVSSPCALVLSIPSAVLAAIAWGARHGVLFRGGAAVEKLAEINTVCLDKTGTLTTGELRVEKVESFPAGREAEIEAIAYSLERLSTHPLARAITRHGKQMELQVIEFDHFESVTGQGLIARRNGITCRLGRREWVEEGREWGGAALPPEHEPGISEIWIAQDGLVGRILLRDDIRPQSSTLVDELRAKGLRSIVLTGDRQAAADHLLTRLGLDDVQAGLKPDGKVAAIQKLTAEGRKVAMVGDGVNDAPSLAASHVGVAMGARGSDAALEQADVVLMHDRLENFLAAFRLSVRARRIIRQNLILSLGVVIVLVTLAVIGKIPLAVGVIGHEGSTVLVVMNSLRLLFGQPLPAGSETSQRG